MKQSDTLVRMANQIGKFFAVQGEERAIAGISDHIKKFWEPRMKSQIFAHIDAGGEGLDPLVLRALQGLRAAMATASAASPPAASSAPRPASKAKNGNGERGKAAAE
jgi:formate dehydrogenase subunit delta